MKVKFNLIECIAQLHNDRDNSTWLNVLHHCTMIEIINRTRQQKFFHLELKSFILHWSMPQLQVGSYCINSTTQETLKASPHHRVWWHIDIISNTGWMPLHFMQQVTLTRTKGAVLQNTIHQSKQQDNSQPITTQANILRKYFQERQHLVLSKQLGCIRCHVSSSDLYHSMVGSSLTVYLYQNTMNTQWSIVKTMQIADGR